MGAVLQGPASAGSGKAVENHSGGVGVAVFGLSDSSAVGGRVTVTTVPDSTLAVGATVPTISPRADHPTWLLAGSEHRHLQHATTPVGHTRVNAAAPARAVAVRTWFHNVHPFT